MYTFLNSLYKVAGKFKWHMWNAFDLVNISDWTFSPMILCNWIFFYVPFILGWNKDISLQTTSSVWFSNLPIYPVCLLDSPSNWLRINVYRALILEFSLLFHLFLNSFDMYTCLWIKYCKTYVYVILFGLNIHGFCEVCL